MSAREAALLTLVAMEREKAWSDGRLRKTIREQGLDRRDAALATRLCLGVVQNRMLLDFYLQQFSTMKLSKMESKVRTGLRIGLYQMLFLTKIPVSAAVSEAVELTKEHCKNQRAAGLVNGVLRAAARHLDDLPTIDRADPVSYLSLLYSHPRWLVEAFLDRLGPEETEALLAWDNGEPDVTVQVVTCRHTTEAATRSLEEEGVTVRPHPWLTDCLILTGTGDLAERAAYQEGMIYAQDPAARLAVLAAGLRPGDRVLDACAAPGGKSFAAAMVLGDEGSITACDIHSHKIALIEAGARRLGLGSITAHVHDGREHEPAWDGAFDAVLADVPCSGLGVIQKKPEIRYKDPEALAGLPRVQTALLENLCRYVRPGGVLLYSTCTLLRAEDEDVVAGFLAAHPEFVREGFTLPGPVGAVPEGEITLWPQRTGTDGFYLARLRRKEATP